MDEIITLIQNLQGPEKALLELEYSDFVPPRENEGYWTLQQFKNANVLVYPLRVNGVPKNLPTPQGQCIILNIIKQWLRIRQRHCIQSAEIFVHPDTKDVKIHITSLLPYALLGPHKDLTFLEHVVSHYTPEPCGFGDLKKRIKLLLDKKADSDFSSLVHHPALWSLDKLQSIITSLDMYLYLITIDEFKEIRRLMRPFTGEDLLKQGSWKTLVPKALEFRDVLAKCEKDIDTFAKNTQHNTFFGSFLGFLYYMRHCYAHLSEYVVMTPYDLGRVLFCSFEVLLCPLIISLNITFSRTYITSSKSPANLSRRNVLDDLNWLVNLSYLVPIR